MSKKIIFIAITAAFLLSFSASETSNNSKFYQQELYSCAWFPICGDPDFSQKSEKNTDSSSKDKKDQKESGRMA